MYRKINRQTPTGKQISQKRQVELIDPTESKEQI